MGRCPTCDAWSSFEEVRQTAPAGTPRRTHSTNAQSGRLVRLDDIVTTDVSRLAVSSAELGRVLGGGIVPGSLNLIGGDPGVGKSTLLSQVADDVARHSGPVVYVSGEESLAQDGLRARRMGLDARDLRLLA
jgi:DNA repair protein RadA/Sms